MPCDTFIFECCLGSRRGKFTLRLYFFSCNRWKWKSGLLWVLQEGMKCKITKHSFYLRHSQEHRNKRDRVFEWQQIAVTITNKFHFIIPLGSVLKLAVFDKCYSHQLFDTTNKRHLSFYMQSIIYYKHLDWSKQHSRV